MGYFDHLPDVGFDRNWDDEEPNPEADKLNALMYPDAPGFNPAMDRIIMPMKPGKSKKVVSENIKEFHKGKTYKKTKAKFGKKKADAQAKAAALSNARKKKR